ncbi:hypothetical protein BN2475_90024 [Paraburkholderia ribeironis]|uniref:Uncharacterized protein n=1 Tax=Paraburkholderia ribeironis TaxID=1247936 RepID=A0A1N7RMW6_9BURK|nr:hypothetical protein BN2475_90024 [Paraburkholderia ribeironis]
MRLRKANAALTAGAKQRTSFDFSGANAARADPSLATPAAIMRG